MPDKDSHELRVNVHASANPRSDRAVRHLLEQLNTAELTYPGTTLKRTYALAQEAPIRKAVPENNPGDQEV